MAASTESRWLESWWHQDAAGDFTTNPAICAPGHPIGADGRPGQCPESIGLMQIRTQYFRAYIDTAVASSAYNLDVAYAVWRSCFEGTETWLNTVERGRQYAAATPGDAWGAGSPAAGTRPPPPTTWRGWVTTWTGGSGRPPSSRGMSPQTYRCPRRRNSLMCMASGSRWYAPLLASTTRPSPSNNRSTASQNPCAAASIKRT